MLQHGYFALLKHLFDVLVADLVEGEAFLGSVPGEEVALKFVVGAVDVEAQVEEGKNCAVMAFLMLRQLPDVE